MKNGIKVFLLFISFLILKTVPVSAAIPTTYHWIVPSAKPAGAVFADDNIGWQFNAYNSEWSSSSALFSLDNVKYLSVKAGNAGGSNDSMHKISLYKGNGDLVQVIIDEPAQNGIETTLERTIDVSSLSGEYYIEWRSLGYYYYQGGAHYSYPVIYPVTLIGTGDGYIPYDNGPLSFDWTNSVQITETVKNGYANLGQEFYINSLDLSAIDSITFKTGDNVNGYGTYNKFQADLIQGDEEINLTTHSGTLNGDHSERFDTKEYAGDYRIRFITNNTSGSVGDAHSQATVYYTNRVYPLYVEATIKPVFNGFSGSNLTEVENKKMEEQRN